MLNRFTEPVPNDSPDKDELLRTATSTLNEASRISPSFPPLLLARGVLCLLRAAISTDKSHRGGSLRDAAKAFDDCLRATNHNNMMALLGKARTLFSMHKYADAYKVYQQILQKAPDLTEPDPRIGIGCCLWQLGFKDDARVAWERAREINKNSKVALILLGLYHLQKASSLQPTSPQFLKFYKRAIHDYIKPSFDADNDFALANATFGAVFLPRKLVQKVMNASKSAIELTDANAIASDGWYLRARTQHQSGELASAAESYQKADQARGGDEAGYIPAKFGLTQLRVMQKDYDGAKFRLEKLIQQNKSPEAMSLLAALFAEDVFNSNPTATAEEIASSAKKAVSLLEAVRVSWKDPAKHVRPDTGVLLNLARLYEHDNPDKAMQCLQQVEEIELNEFEDRPEDPEELSAWLAEQRKQLDPQLLNNIACYHYHSGRLLDAQDYFQSALEACGRLATEENTADTDALVTTITFNLGRAYEAHDMPDEAQEAYQGLLQRHGNYVDAKIRRACIALNRDPNGEGPKLVKELYANEADNMDARALYAWFLERTIVRNFDPKKKSPDPALDPEQRHLKHMLQNFDKADRHALTSMGNFWVNFAREMRPRDEEEKARRRTYYARAGDFFAKSIQYDPRNAYAAQGVAIVMVEDLRDFSGALQILIRVRETLKDFSVHLNLGHVYCELKQYQRAIESYEAALGRAMLSRLQNETERDKRERHKKSHFTEEELILPCLGRAWFMRARQEKSTYAYKKALDYSRQAHEKMPDINFYQFDVAYAQNHVAQHLISVQEQHRSLDELQQGAEDLAQAIESYEKLKKEPHPPYPEHDLEQRANMCNTLKRQLNRAIEKQKEFEEKNVDRLRKAREAREEEMRRKEEERRKQEAEAAEQRRKIAEERKAMQERDREIAAQREEEERRLREEDEPEYDSEGNVIEKKGKKRKSAKRKKKAEDFINDDDDLGVDADGLPPDGSDKTPAGSADERPRKKKKRKLEKKSKSSKYKSADYIDDSDEDLPVHDAPAEPMDTGEDGVFGDGDGEKVKTNGVAKRRKKVVDDDDEEDDENVTAAGEADGAMPLDGTFAGNEDEGE